MKLNKLKPRLEALRASRLIAIDGQRSRDRRMTGRGLQDRRLKLWSEQPNCTMCGRFTVYPHGFELDHKVPLFKGGSDTEDNCQILCNGPDGCHDKKTKQDFAAMKFTIRG